ncbi:hypothetical protein [Sphingomonas aracearum]|nr:hypothetical protein [Sphingomonas aracearum]
MTKLILGGGAMVSLAGGALAADKAGVHTAEIPLGNGQVATVRYVGDVPPKIRIVPVERVAVSVALVDPGFATFDRMVAEMNARRDAMLRQVAAMAAQAPAAGASRVSLRQLPAGTVSYSFVSTTGADGCTRTVRTSYTAGQPQPQVIRQQSAGCRATDRAPTPAAAPGTSAPAKVTPVAAPVAAKKPFDPRTI